MPTSTTPTIILVEDDEGHARLIEKNLRRAGVQNPIRHFTDGTTALAELLAEPTDTHRAFLILLDLNLPDMSGADILIRLKADARLRRAPVVILTTTDDQREMQRCYDLGASVYVTKPVIYEDFAAAIRQLGSFFAIVQIPELAPV
ncbi:MAG: response regulator [Proteobacteria bacterium]|nr:MAG: response regulator [Pseudomonadota bacterium]